MTTQTHSSQGKTGSEAKNLRTLLLMFSLAAMMIGLSFASVPLYRLFCQVTGFGGTPKIDQSASVASATATGQHVDTTAYPVYTVRFDANTDPKLPWRFEPVDKTIELRAGENVTINYVAENLTNRPITGMATFNVTPIKAASYFVKIDCFCFDEQTLEPHEKVLMPVNFYIDPEIMDERRLTDVHTLTLSYTFFKAVDGAQ